MRTTRPPNETPEEETDQCVAIVDMVQALDPRDATQASHACHIVAIGFMADGALRAVNDPNANPDQLPRLRASALAASRTLSHLHTKYQKLKDAAEAAASPPKPAHAREPAPSTRQRPPLNAAIEPPPTSPNRDRTPTLSADEPAGQARTEPRTPSPEVAAWMERAGHRVAASFEKGMKTSEALFALSRMA
jgi:hypothetical protein